MDEAIVIIHGKVKGNIKLKDTKRGLKIMMDLRNRKEGYHGFHVHDFGDISDGTNSLGSHYNPDKKR